MISQTSRSAENLGSRSLSRATKKEKKETRMDLTSEYEAKTARVIVTFNCERKCVYCCNKYGRIMAQATRISDISSLRGFSTICVTGGEPLLSPEKTLSIIRDIREVCVGAPVYLYTARFVENMSEILDAVDGIHFTLHDSTTANEVDHFNRLQDMLRGRTGSYRLYISPSITLPVTIVPNLWKRVEVKPWMSEQQLLDIQPGGLPVGESVFILAPTE